MQRALFSVWQADDPTKRLVTDGETLERLVRFLESRRVNIIDYETSGVAWHRHSEAVGIGLGAWDDQERFWSAYVPFAHRTGEHQLDPEVVKRAVSPLLLSATIVKGAHNIKFEDHFTRKWIGSPILGPRYCTMVAARLYNEDDMAGLDHRARVDLKQEDASHWAKIVTEQCNQLAKARRMKVKEYKARYGYSELPIGLTAVYCGTDLHQTGGLLSFYEKWGVSSRFTRIWPTEMALTEILCDMEQNGLPVDREYLARLRGQLEVKKGEVEAKLKSALGPYADLDIGSDEQIRHFLTQVLRLPLTERTRKNAISIEADVLTQFKDHHPFIPLFLEWNEVEKLLSTYTQSILDRCDANDVLHCDFQQVGTNTGRLSSKEPNFQNFPTDDDERAVASSGKKVEDGGVDPWSIRRAFVVPEPDRTDRLFFDYSQVELRVLAYYSRDPIMLDVYCVTKGDIHKRTQKEIAELAHRDVPRRIAKIVNFGLSYCLTEKGLAKQARIPEQEAAFFMEKFFERYAGIKLFRYQFWSAIRNTADLSFQNLFGRRRCLPNLNSPLKWERSRAERQAIGTLVQGTAAELTKESLVRIDRALKAERLPAKLVNTVHDEIQIDTPKECRSRVVRVVREAMESYPEFAPVPIVVDVARSDKSWADKEHFEEAA